MIQSRAPHRSLCGAPCFFIKPFRCASGWKVLALRSALFLGCVVCVLFILCTSPLRLSADAGSLPFRQISLEQGLSQSSVYAIVQDRQGFMWLGTQDGLNRFDGYTLTVFRQQAGNAHSLPNNCIQTLYEDRSGMLWIGTRGGGAARRNPFTGVFSPAYTLTNTLLGNDAQDVYAFAEDNNGRMWIGTGAGLLCIHSAQGTVEEQWHSGNSPLQHSMIRAITTSADGTLWIATPNGLYSYHPTTKQWRTFLSTKNTNTSRTSASQQTAVRISTILPDNDIYALLPRKTELWVGTASALLLLNTTNGEVLRTIPHPASYKSTVNALALYSNQARAGLSHSPSLWIGYGGGGIHEINLTRLSASNLASAPQPVRRVYRHDVREAHSLRNDVVLSIYHDRFGGLWVGTDGAGVNYCHPDEYRFERFSHDAAGTGGNIILSITEDRTSNIWIGTLSGGIARFHPDRHDFTVFRSTPANPRSIPSNAVWTLITDRTGALWAGTSSGLSRFNPTRNDFTNYYHDPNNPNSLPDNNIFSLCEDTQGNIWIATNGGLARFHPASGIFMRFQNNPRNSNTNTISSNFVRKIYQDRNGILWIGTRGGGLNRFDPASATFLHFRHNPADSTSISNDYILSITEDHTGTLWIGTAGGLNKFDPNSGTFTNFSESNGLPNNYVCGVLEDDNGNLWLGTVRGICKFDPRAGSFTTFEELYSRSGREFNQDACTKTRNGMLYFGGVTGFVRFHPDSIRINHTVPPVVLTGFKKFNKPVDMAHPVDSAINAKQELHLTVDDTFISFEFAALSFTLPHKISYSCKLEGFDNNWIELGNKREATYTNLDAGSYIFRVRATNYDGVWNEEGAHLRVIIHPHWWQAIWVKLGVAALCGVLIFVGYTWRVRRVEERNKKLEQTIAERTAALSLSNHEITRQNETLTQLNQEKNEFLGIAAHDLKNPLTAIMMSSSIVKQYHTKMTSDEIIEQMEHILITAKRMKETILNLLDINSIESGKFKFSSIPMNIVEVVNDVVEGYYLRAKDKEITLHLNTEVYEIMTFADRNAFMQVMENLISNSIKYSPLGKNVYVSIISSVSGELQALFARQEHTLERKPMKDEHVRIEIQDEGPGLTDEDKKKLFGKFAKLSAKPTGGEHSTGLGLSIVKKIVEAMHGRVWCESEAGNGATFIVELPIVPIPPEFVQE